MRVIIYKILYSRPNLGGGCKSCLIEGGRQFSTGRCCQSKGKASTLNNLEGSIRGLEKRGETLSIEQQVK